MLQYPGPEGGEVGDSILLPERLPHELDGQEGVLEEKPAPDDEIEGVVELEEEWGADGDRAEILLAPGSPEVHLIGLKRREVVEPLVVGDRNEEAHWLSKKLRIVVWSLKQEVDMWIGRSGPELF